MFVTKSQVYVFIACVAFGGACGILLSVSAALKFFIKNKVVKILPDLIFFAIIGVFYASYAYLLKLPNLRAYMLAGVFIGMLLYFKSFHILLAKYTKKLYNILKEKFKIIKVKYVRARKRKSSTNGGKTKEVNSGRYGRSGVAISNTFVGDGISVNIHKR